MPSPLGFIRVEKFGERPFYVEEKSPQADRTPRRLYHKKDAADYLEKMKTMGVYLKVELKDFDFKKKGVKKV